MANKSQNLNEMSLNGLNPISWIFLSSVLTVKIIVKEHEEKTSWLVYIVYCVACEA